MKRVQYGEVTESVERNIGFYLSNNFSMLPFVSSVEPLRIANRLSREPLYQWSIFTHDGEPVYATNGMVVHAKYSIETTPEFSMVFVCGPHEPKRFNDTSLLKWLKTQAKRNIVIGGIETGSYILAQAGLIDNVPCTTHWENISEFIERFPGHNVSSDLFEVDGNRVTCAGGSASMDMMLYVIERHHGHELAAAIADVMIHPNIRHASEPQRMNIQARIGVNHPILVECIELMESNIEQPLSPHELANLIGVSKRQLERLFRRYLNTTPARFYLTLRLGAARDMLEKSALKIIDIAIACGFKSAGHFSSRYYSSFGITPRETRKPQLDA